MELRHLRYFTAVVQWKGYREAARHLFVAQPSISQAVADLENEIGIKLFSREGRAARLTPEGKVFHEEALKTLAQADRSVAAAQRAAKGQIGRLGIGFMGFAAYSFLPDLIRKYKARYPGVSLRLVEDIPSGQDTAFDRGELKLHSPGRSQQTGETSMNRVLSSASLWSRLFPRAGMSRQSASVSRNLRGSGSSVFSAPVLRKCSILSFGFATTMDSRPSCKMSSTI